MTEASLRKRLSDIENHLEVLRAAEEKFLFLDAHKKVLSAQLFLKSEGKSVAEREAIAFASYDWIDFSKGLAEAESKFNHERRMHELLLKKYDAAHLSLKMETPVINRHGHVS